MFIAPHTFANQHFRNRLVQCSLFHITLLTPCFGIFCIDVHFATEFYFPLVLEYLYRCSFRHRTLLPPCFGILCIDVHFATEFCFHVVSPLFRDLPVGCPLHHRTLLPPCFGIFWSDVHCTTELCFPHVLESSGLLLLAPQIYLSPVTAKGYPEILFFHQLKLRTMSLYQTLPKRL